MSETKVSKRVLNIVLNHLANTASTDFTRYHLNGVRIKFKVPPGLWLIDSTNGHVLCRNEVPAADVQTGIDGDIFIRSEHVAMLKAKLKTVPKYAGDDFMIDISSEAVKDDMFPDVDQVIPRLTGDEHVVSFNAEYLYEMLKAMREDKRTVNIRLRLPANPASPITVNIANGDSTALGVLMPIRDDVAQRAYKEKQTAELETA